MKELEKYKIFFKEKDKSGALSADSYASESAPFVQPFPNNVEINNLGLKKRRKPFRFHFKERKGEIGKLCFYSNVGIDTYQAGCKHDCNRI